MKKKVTQREIKEGFKAMKYKANKLNLLFVLYQIEDKQQYKNKTLSKYIDNLQKHFKNK